MSGELSRLLSLRSCGIPWEIVISCVPKESTAVCRIMRADVLACAVERLRCLDQDATVQLPVSILSSGARLRRIDMYGCNKIVDFGPLRMCSSTLEELILDGTRITSLEPIAGCWRLRQLKCAMTLVDSLEPLRNVVGLEDLDCSCTGVADIEPLTGCTRLQSLALDYTIVVDLAPIAHATGLRHLTLSKTPIHSIPHLPCLTDMDCSHSRVTQLPSSCAELVNLDLNHTMVDDLAPLAEAAKLERLDCSACPDVYSIAPLAGCHMLEHLDCSYTPVTSLQPLADGCHRLTDLTCVGTGVRDLSPILALTALVDLRWSK